MLTSARYISVNNCKNQPPKAVQPATKQSAGLFLPNLQTNLEHQGCATCCETVHRTVSAKFANKFGAACRWSESIDRMKNTEHTNVYSVFLAPQVGLEPTTLRLTAACSTN